GDVEILAASVDLSSAAEAGDGGGGGAAVAEAVELAPGAPSIVDRGESAADEEEDGGDDQPLPAAGAARAQSRAGGNGGSILIQSVGVRGGLLLAPDASLRAGNGGATARASARGGKDASAVMEKPGAGGDVALRWAGLTAPSTGWVLVPGSGGDAGLLGAISGSARGHDSASAKTAGGGDAGKTSLGASSIGAGEGGDSGNVLAQTDQDAKYDFGEAGSRSAAGKPTAAQAP
ncbi:MAG: hypothetical protein ACHQ2Z_12320, partial [Elusimicrobiota bacterium]